MIHYLRVHPGWAWPLGSLVMAGLIYGCWKLSGWWTRGRPEPLIIDGIRYYRTDAHWWQPWRWCAADGAGWIPGAFPTLRQARAAVAEYRAEFEYAIEPVQEDEPAEWDELGPEEQADQLIHEWHDDPAEVTQPWSLLDEWWSDLDGLERECELLHMSTREQDRAWAELIEETRALCPLAAA